MAIVLNSVTTQSVSTGTPITIPSSLGNLIAIAYLGDSIGTFGPGVTSVTDSNSNPYSGVGGSTAVADPEIWYAKNTAQGVTSVTVNFTAVGSQNIVVYDLGGADPYAPVDQVSTTGAPQGPTTNPIDGISPLSMNGDFLITAFGSSGITGISPSPPWELDFVGGARAAGHYFSPPTTSVSWQWFTSNTTWGSTSVAFKLPIATFDLTPGTCIVWEP